MKLRSIRSEFPRHRFPAEPWRLVETEPSEQDLGWTEVLFAIGNGYIGMRGNPSEGRNAHTHGTYANGFHETWEIHHAESAHAFAKTGQTLINIPDAKLMKLYVDDEPLRIGGAELVEYERAINFQTGISHRDILWRTPAAKRVRVRTERMVSLEHRHLAVMQMTVTLEAGAMESGPTPIVVSSQLLNRQDGQDEYHVPDAALGEAADPRKGRQFDRRVLVPTLQRHDDPEDASGGSVFLGYRAARSAMTIACAYRHEITGDVGVAVETSIDEDLAKSALTFELSEGQSVTITKYVSYHTSTGVPADELADRCDRTINRAVATGFAELAAGQRRWLDGFWDTADLEITGPTGDPGTASQAAIEDQQALRWNLFQLAQASARADEHGIAAKGVTSAGYDGHYFWDTEVYVVPFLAYTNAEAARKLLRFRYKMLPNARERARELSQVGALYPWRTINGQEASAYYAAGTAQYHINAAIMYGLERYVYATGDLEFLASEGAEMLVETARLYEDLGFFSDSSYNGPRTEPAFHIHGVTGPDEYTTVVNDNTYTNVMARFTLRFAARVVSQLRDNDAEAYESLVRNTGVTDDDVDGWNRAADAMFIPYDEELKINPQDDAFTHLERWDFANTPADQYPLLLHFHPLVIYRHQVLKQADVVLAMFLRGQQFDRETKRRNFDYYDPITTGDSSLSACVQSIAAAEVGYDDLAWDYFRQSLYLDLADTHHNTSDGVHIANSGGVWAGCVYGFAGFTDTGQALSFEPRLPAAWSELRFTLVRHQSKLEVTVHSDHAVVTLLDGPAVPIRVGDELVSLEPDRSVTVPRRDEASTAPSSTAAR